MKTFAVNVERHRRNTYQRISAKILAIRSPQLFFQDMGDNFLAEIHLETSVIAVIVPRNTGNRC